MEQLEFGYDDQRTVQERFDDFHQRNPRVYELFCKHVRDAIAAGKKKVSSKMIINVIRWNFYLETDSDDSFKINDRYTAYYARQYIKDNPETRELFELRAIRKV